jgi:hypothetical protein
MGISEAAQSAVPQYIGGALGFFFLSAAKDFPVHIFVGPSSFPTSSVLGQASSADRAIRQLPGHPLGPGFCTRQRHDEPGSLHSSLVYQLGPEVIMHQGCAETILPWD